LKERERSIGGEVEGERAMMNNTFYLKKE